MYLYQPERGCSYLPAPQVTSDGEKLGKVTSRVGKETIKKENSVCAKEFDADFVEWVYSAANQSGVDKFKS